MTEVPDDVAPGRPIRIHTFLNAILATLRELARGPRVAAPLAVLDGVIYYAGELKLYRAKATSAVAGRVGLQLGMGTATLYANDAQGLLSARGGFADRKVWNDNGSSIPSGTWIKVYFAEGIWNVFNADTCSGES